MACTGSAVSRAFQAGAGYANGEFIQVHPTAIPGADKLRLMSESARGEGGRVWVPRRPQDPRPPQQIPESERYYFLEERYPKYGNLVPRDIATREIFKVCIQEGLSVRGGPAVRLPRREPPAAATCWTASWPASWKSTRSSRAPIPRTTPMKIFPAVHYSMGGLWCDYEPRADGGLAVGSPRNQQTNIPGPVAIGECDYQFHGANRLGANSLVACIFSGLIVAPGVRGCWQSLAGGQAAEQPAGAVRAAAASTQAAYKAMLARPPAVRTPTAAPANWAG